MKVPAAVQSLLDNGYMAVGTDKANDNYDFVLCIGDKFTAPDASL